MLFGPPGSGKTTTLIKRLAQKRTPDALTEDEERLISGHVGDNLLRPDSWAMFSPAELLKQYLGEAFNQEGVPDAGNVRTWNKERHDLARNVLNILRSNSSGRFQLDENLGLLVDGSSQGVTKLHDEFATYVELNVLKRCNDAMVSLLASTDENVRRAAANLQRALGNTKDLGVSDLLRLFDRVEGLQAEIRRISDHIPRSRDNPELRWVYDTEVVRDLIAVGAPVPGHVVAQEVQHCDAEVPKGAVALVVGGVSVHQPP